MGFTLYQTGVLHGLPDRLAFEQDAISIGDLFHMLSAEYGEYVCEEILGPDGEVAEGAMVILNGCVIKGPHVLATMIPPGGELVVSALIAGG